MAQRNPSGLQVGPGDEPARAYSIVDQPREEGAKARTLAQLDAIVSLAMDAEYLYWTAPATPGDRSNYCVWRMSKTGGERAAPFCDSNAHLSMLGGDRGHMFLVSNLHEPGTREVITVLALGAPGEAPAPALRWAGSYPGAFGVALAGDAVAFKVKGEVGILSR